MRSLLNRTIVMAGCLSLSLCLGANARNPSSVVNLQPELLDVANVEEPLNLESSTKETLIADRRYRRRRVSRRRDCNRPYLRASERDRYVRRDRYRDYPATRRDRYRDYPVTRRDRYRDYREVRRRDYPEDYQAIRRDRRRDYREARRDYEKDLRQLERDYRDARRDYFKDVRQINY